jgi:hypothetical protein
LQKDFKEKSHEQLNRAFCSISKGAARAMPDWFYHGRICWLMVANIKFGLK